MHVFTAAFRTRDLVLFVFRKGEDDFEWLVAIFAEKFVSRHDDPQSNSAQLILQRWTLGMAARKMDAPKGRGVSLDIFPNHTQILLWYCFGFPR